MRKIILQEWLSADGYAADANGTTSFFENPKWGRDSDDEMRDFIATVDAILLGANTYKMFMKFWPTAAAEKEIVAQNLNETPKFIFSNSLNEVEWGEWENANLVKGDAIEEIIKMKNQSGSDMVLWGSIALTQSLIKAKLIDEIHIRTVPVILGKGRLLFGESDKIQLKTTEVKQYDSGLILTSFEVINE